MVIWFAAAAFTIVVLVFSSPAIDYRLVMLGAVLPVGEAAFGGPYLLHTLVGSAALLVVVVLATRGRRLAARQLVGLPIGTFLHLVLDGTWARRDIFWWPIYGADALGEGQVPEIEHLRLSIALEVVGIVLAVWLVRRFELTVPRRRDEFVRTGRLGRDLLR
ncbi:MAG TPA: hypothetical protein VF183_10245 [Acidimicrobiales bacterium]